MNRVNGVNGVNGAIGANGVNGVNGETSRASTTFTFEPSSRPSQEYLKYTSNGYRSNEDSAKVTVRQMQHGVNGNKEVTTVLLVGLGHRTLKKALPVLRALDTDRPARIVHAIEPQFPPETASEALGLTVYPDVVEYLEKQEILPDVAYVAVPHAAYSEVLPALLKASINVLKEKPLAMNLSEALKIVDCAKKSRARAGVLCQRRFSHRYDQLRSWLPRVGRISSVRVVESIVVPRLDEGWRAQKSLAGGGVVLDMGYHMLDQLVGLWGPDFVVKHADLLMTRDGDYDVEDTAHLAIQFQGAIHVDVVLSRAAFEAEEMIEVIGEKGVLKLKSDSVVFSRFNKAGEVLLDQSRFQEKGEEMLGRAFSSFISGSDEEKWDLNRDLAVMQLVQEIYASWTPLRPYQAQVPETRMKKWSWPRVTREVEIAVEKQLHKTLSIYDNSGVIADFESAFKSFHGSAKAHVLLHNSGTNALHALYYSAGIGPGDEVLVPVYTFHATVSPLMQLGAKPVFIDALAETGNIDPNKIQAFVGPKTKALIITHMWGMPCAMQQIVNICREAGILLLEGNDSAGISLKAAIDYQVDCSHAHGAVVADQIVGTFGDGAAWSIQGEKIISGGEGGVSLTPHPEMYYRQLLHGHYNKRCKSEIPTDHPLRAFALTGTGLKNRAHPLAVSIALTQLAQLPTIASWKSKYAAYIVDALKPFPFLRAPVTEAGVRPAWYALIIRFDPDAAPHGLTRERYVEEVMSRGMKDIDIPGSTKPIYDEPLYVRPWDVLPHLYPVDSIQFQTGKKDFSGAAAFHAAAIKLPVWTHEDDFNTVKECSRIMTEVANGFVTGLLKV